MPVRSGTEYVAGLQDGRDVWYRGKQVEDMTVHPAFASGLQMMSQLYDLQHHPVYQQIMTYSSPRTGEAVGQSFRMPRCVEELTLRRSMLDTWATATGGMLVQSPDYANIGLMALASARDLLATGDPRFGVHALRYYEQCREQDLCVAHVPAVVRLPSETTRSYPAALRATASQSQGIRVSGIYQPAPLAPLAHELLVCGGAALTSGQGQHALAFSLPLATPGITLVCREARDRSHASPHTLATPLDMPNCMLVFEDVLIPWERVFLSGNVELHNRLMTTTGFAAHVGHQVLTRQVVKVVLLLGMAEQLSRSIGMTEQLHMQAKLGELIMTLEAMRSCLRRAEVDAVVGPGSAWMPDWHAIRAGQRLLQGLHPRMVEILHLLESGSHIMVPSEAALDGPMSRVKAKYDLEDGMTADAWFQLYGLTLDMVGGPVGMRLSPDETDTPADVVRAMAYDYQDYDLQPAIARTQAFLQASDSQADATT